MPDVSGRLGTVMRSGALLSREKINEAHGAPIIRFILLLNQLIQTTMSIAQLSHFYITWCLSQAYRYMLQIL